VTRYSVVRRETKKTTEQTHAVWRGIGCLLALIVPLMSWLLGVETVGLALGQGWPLPYQLLGYPVLPEDLWSVRALWPILNFIGRQQHLYLSLLFMVLYVIVISAVLSFIYSFVYRMVGPPRYGPLDLPQPKIKVGRYKR
jgi:hypothetical protein